MERHDGFNKGFMFGLATGTLAALVLYKNRRSIRTTAWKLRIKAEVYGKIPALRRLTREAFEDLVDEVIDRYYDLGSIAEYELEQFADELKQSWRNVKRRFEGAVSSLRKDEEDEESV